MLESEMTLTFAPEHPPLRMDEGGVCRVSGTRVSLESILAAFEQGAGPEEIADRYPVVPLADVYAVLAYSLKHREEVEGYLRECDAQEAELAREIDSRLPAGWRERLLARRKPVLK
jgi:uncharacterized protein (DUF433 family)